VTASIQMSWSCWTKQPTSFVAIGSILEVGAFYSLKVRDVSAFARYEAMLSGYYRDFKWVGFIFLRYDQDVR
jgi:hypothetical protein